MRHIINRKTAIEVIILLLTLICIMTIWPLRIFADTFEYSPGGNLLDESITVNFEDNAVQKFITRYDRLKSVDVYVSEMTEGRYLSVAVRNEEHTELLRVLVDTADYQLPDYVNVPMELDVEPGKEYYLLFEGCRSKYNLGFEDIPENPEYVGSLYTHWNEIPGRHISCFYNYKVPMSRSRSLMYIGILAAVAAVLIIAERIFFKLNPEKNSLLTVGKTVKYVANPLNAIVFLTLMIMVFPLRIFDSRPIDIIFYEIGLIVCAGIGFYAINHNVVRHSMGVSFWQTIEGSDRPKSCLMMFTIAMSLWYACAYMNDLYDIYHTLSERRMVIWLILTMLLTFTFREAFNIPNLLWLAASVIAGVRYYGLHSLADTEKEYDLHNMALKYGIIIVILGGFVVISLIRRAAMLLRKRFLHITEHDSSRSVITAFGILLLVFMASIIIFRNTRWWGVAMSVTFICLYLRIAGWQGKKNWYKILAGGLMVNFLLSLGFSLLHRYFAGFVSGRFAFIFHTVTVTAEYLALMAAVATVMLVAKIVAMPKKCGVVLLFKSAWKEIVLFGWILSYAVFTVSRTAILSIAVTVIAVILVTVSVHKKQFFRIIGVMAAAAIICFPGAFTLQRILPTIVARPTIYLIDDTDVLVRGGADWNSTNFMCVERFAGLFGEKILGVDLGDYHYPVDKNNYDEDGNPYYDHYGFPIDQSNEEYYYDDQGKVDETGQEHLLASAGFTRAEAHMLSEEMNGYVDTESRLDMISNGRITIFKAYAKELNLTGHDEMGALLPNGEIAVHAHNTYMQVAYDHGIPVGILFMVLLIAAAVLGVKLYRKNCRQNPILLLIFAVVMAFAFAGISEWVFQFCNPMTVALMLAFAGLTFKEAKD
ncbi:O-antigen ligase family protein [Butyrivibrio sp. MC2021]|uniref:O-antigen ligase family protein n=1 Tax=Butyrivibrio sp. MC2021 TaxID=1408306 RepID=UPI0012DE8E8B|nr:hypothetical protein [Butyrivibrio sp. MC2021]